MYITNVWQLKNGIILPAMRFERVNFRQILYCNIDCQIIFVSN